LVAYFWDGGSFFEKRGGGGEGREGGVCDGFWLVFGSMVMLMVMCRKEEERLTNSSSINLNRRKQIREKRLYTGFLTLLLDDRTSDGQATKGEDGKV
jgi:hypothetical protein